MRERTIALSAMLVWVSIIGIDASFRGWATQVCAVLEGLATSPALPRSYSIATRAGAPAPDD